MPALTAAVIGASGIGKHHAKWLHRLGCNVGAFAGTSPESVASTSDTLEDLFGFDGTGYPSVEQMLEAGRWDIISICSPEHLHYDHFMRAIDHGAHVMVEKPIVFDPALEHATMLDMGERMVAAARDARRVAAINTQYVAAAASYRKLMGEIGAEIGQVDSFFMQMESRGGAEGTDYEQIFIDLGPHPLSLLMAFCGPGEMVAGSESCRVERKCVEAEFVYRREEGGDCHVYIVCRNRPEGELIRRFGVNDVLVDYEGRNDEKGIYRAYLSHEGREICDTDFVETSLQRFVGAVRGDVERPLATAAEGLQNLQMQLTLLAGAERV